MKRPTGMKIPANGIEYEVFINSPPQAQITHDDPSSRRLEPGDEIHVHRQGEHVGGAVWDGATWKDAKLADPAVRFQPPVTAEILVEVLNQFAQHHP